MRKIIALTLAAFWLTGCAGANKAFQVVTTTITNPVSSTNLYQAELVFDGSVKTFNELKGLCARRVLPSVCRTYVRKGQDLIRRAYAADLAAQDFIVQNPMLNATGAVLGFTNAVSSFNATLTRLSALKQ